MKEWLLRAWVWLGGWETVKTFWYKTLMAAFYILLIALVLGMYAWLKPS